MTKVRENFPEEIVMEMGQRISRSYFGKEKRRRGSLSRVNSMCKGLVVGRRMVRRDCKKHMVSGAKN